MLSHVFATLHDAACKTDCTIVKTTLPKPTRGETPIRSIHACFHSAYLKTKTLASLIVDLRSNGPVRKFTGASFLAETLTRLNTLKRRFRDGP